MPDGVWSYMLMLVTQSFWELITSFGMTFLGFLIIYIAIPVMVFVIPLLIAYIKQRKCTTAARIDLLKPKIKPALLTFTVTTVIWFVLFLVFFFCKIYKDHKWLMSELNNCKSRITSQEEELEFLRFRVRQLIGYLPRQKLTKEKEAEFCELLKSFGRQQVKIKYLDTPYSGAYPLTDLLARLFRDAGWHVKIYPVNKGYEHHDGLLMGVESNGHLTQTENAILDALRDAGINCGTMGGTDVRDHFEFLIGNMY